MKLAIIFAAVLACAYADCDSNKYKKIGCFEIAKEIPQFEEIFDKAGEAFDIDSYTEKLPQLVCDCFEKTKESYKYFSVGHNGHCHGGNSFDKNTTTSDDCVESNSHNGGLEEAEYVYQIKADAATPVDGGAGKFGAWGECSASCDGGKRSRERACVEPLPNDPGKGCEKLTQIEACNEQPCPIDGAFSDWSAYGNCSATCGKGHKERTRKCNNPAPQFRGKVCEGQTSESAACYIKPCPINGAWGAWKVWSSCKAFVNGCGKGEKQRSRECDSPKQQHKGKACVGSKTDKAPCVAEDCVGESKKEKPCEGEKVSLSCPSNWKIKIDEGTRYGRKNGDTHCWETYHTLLFRSSICEKDEEQTKPKITDTCQNKGSCSFDCSNNFFGDPCPGTPKYCDVRYHCEGYNL